MAVEIDEGFRVTITNDQELVTRFMRWQMEEKVWSYRGSSSGMGNSVDWFPMEYKERVTAWLASTRSKST